MSNSEPEAAQTAPRSGAWKTAVTVLQAAHPPSIPEGAEVMTLLERAIYARAHEPRRLADLILVEGDPSDDMSTTRSVRLVIKGGVEMEVC